MASYQTIIINSQGTTNDFKSQCDLSPGQLDALNNFVDYVSGLGGGNMIGADLTFNVGAVRAAATFTVATGGSTNGQEGTLLNTTLAAVTSGAVPADGEFNISATAATQAASMVTAIEAVLGDQVTVSRNNATITITAKMPGALGNGFEISAGNLSNVTAGAFANGADGTAYVLDFE